MEKMMAEFDKLTDEEKIDFFKVSMPSICRIFKQNPQKVMGEMMPYCKEVMKDCNMDISQMMSMMNKIKAEN